MASSQKASTAPLKVDAVSVTTTPVPKTAPARTTSFAVNVQDSTPAPRMSRSASMNKISQISNNGSSSTSKSRGHGQDAESEALRRDIETCRLSLELFLASRMAESEALIKSEDPNMERLYTTSGFGLIQSVKALMSFEDKDIAAAIELVRAGAALANKHRKSLSLTSRVTGLVTGSTSSVAFYKGMTPAQRHAELVYAECLAQKAILGIAHSGDWLQFIKEAINMRACIGLYRSMYAYLEALDAEADGTDDSETLGKSGVSTPVVAESAPTSTRNSGSNTPNKPAKSSKASSSQKHSSRTQADEDFRSGVYLGLGVVHLTLSLLPGRVMPILELFGYKGDRATALRLLERAGGWNVVRQTMVERGEQNNLDAAPIEPGVGKEEEGLRRSLCDIVLLVFHFVFSAITFNGIDVPFAAQVTAYNAGRFPRGIFFLFGQGRLALFKGAPLQAIQFYLTAMDVIGGAEALRGLEGAGYDLLRQSVVSTLNAEEAISRGDLTASAQETDESEFKSLQGLALWELAVARLSLWDIRGGVGCWRRLTEEAGWSKAVYAYGLAVSLYELGEGVALFEEGQGGTISATQLPTVIMEKVDERVPLGENTTSVASGGATDVRDAEKEEAVKYMDSVPGLLKRIAGKSIPFEKFVSRRARKFKAQGGRLLLPSLELAYALLAIQRTPREILMSKMLPSADAALAILKAFEEHPEHYCGVGRRGSDKLKEYINKAHGEKSDATPIASKEEEKPSEISSENGYWDDYCLAQFLRGVCLRYIAYPDSLATAPGNKGMPNAAADAKTAFDFVLENGPKILYDHHIVYWTHYELGKLEARNGNKEEARKHIELVLSGRVLEVNWHGRKGKYSLENALNVRANAALEGLEQDQLL